LPCSSLGSESSERSEPPNCTEPKPKRSRRVGGARQPFEFGAAFRGEQIELLRAMRQAAQAYAEEADFAAMVTMLAKKILEDSEDVGVKLRWLAERFRARVGIEAGVTDGESEGARGEAASRRRLQAFCERWLSMAVSATVSSCLRRKCDCAKWIWAPHRL